MSLSRLLVVVLLATVCSLPATAGEPAKKPAPSAVFDAPTAQARQAAITLGFVQLVRAKRLADAETLLGKAIATPDFDTGVNRYNLACLYAVQNKTDDALVQLAAAIERGYTDTKHMREDADLKSIRALPRFEALMRDADAKRAEAEPKRPKPLPVKDGVATVEESNTFWAARIAQFLVLFEFPEPDAAKPITTMKGAVGDLLR